MKIIEGYKGTNLTREMLRIAIAKAHVIAANEKRFIPFFGDLVEPIFAATEFDCVQSESPPDEQPLALRGYL